MSSMFRFASLGLIAVLLMTTPGFAQQRQQPVTVEADSLTYQGVDGVSRFTGNVRAVSDNLTLTADAVEVRFSDNRTVYNVTGTGNVSITTSEITGLADRAVMDVDAKTVTLMDGARVWQNDNYLEGERVIVYYNIDKILVDKGENSRVRIIFNPEETTGSPSGTAGDKPQEDVQETDGR